jgi:DNA primase
MIPIRDVHGQTIAFAGRQLEGITPPQDPAHDSKYINSPQTSIFRKGEVLFGLDRARQHIQNDGAFLLVEGQLDTLRCHSVGLLTAIAPQGTGVTEIQLHHLRRYNPSLRCFLDSDEAGQKAAIRVLEIALQEEMEVRFILLPQGQDPDIFLRDKKQISLKDLESLTCSAMAFAVQHLLPQGTGIPSGIHEKERALRAIFGFLNPVSSIIIREAYLQEVSRLMKIEYRSILHDFEHFKAQPKMPFSPVSPHHTENSNFLSEKARQPSSKIHSVAYDLLSLIIHHEDLGAPLACIIETTWLERQDSDHQLLQHLLEKFREGSWEGWEHLEEHFTVLECEQLYTILASSDFFENPWETANLCLRKLYKDHIRRAIKELTIPEPSFPIEEKRESLHQEPALQNLLRQKMHLRHLLQHPPQLPPQNRFQSTSSTTL